MLCRERHEMLAMRFLNSPERRWQIWHHSAISILDRDVYLAAVEKFPNVSLLKPPQREADHLEIFKIGEAPSGEVRSGTDFFLPVLEIRFREDDKWFIGFISGKENINRFIREVAARC